MKTKAWWYVGGIVAVLVVAVVAFGKSSLYSGAIINLRGFVQQKTLDKVFKTIETRKQEEKTEPAKPTPEDKKQKEEWAQKTTPPAPTPEEKKQKEEWGQQYAPAPELKKPYTSPSSPNVKPTDQLPDLTVDFYAFQPDPNHPGETVLNVAVKTLHSLPITDYIVKAKPDIGGEPSTVKIAGGLGGTVARVISLGKLTKPTSFHITVDAENAITETDETNNVLVTSIYTPKTAPAPDLIITGYQFDGSVPARVYLFVSVQNVGDKDLTAPFSVSVEDNFGHTGGDDFPTTKIQPGASIQVSISLHDNPAITHSRDGIAHPFTITLITDGVEPNIANNTFKTPPYALPSIPVVHQKSADLVVKTEFERVRSGVANLKVTVKNAGDGAAGSYFAVKAIDFQNHWISGLAFVNKLLAAGETAVVSIPLAGQSTTVDTKYSVTVDATNLVSESNENNNSVTTETFKISTFNPVTVTVTAVDPQNPGVLLANAHVYIFDVTSTAQQNGRYYVGTLRNQGQTGPHGEGAVFTVGSAEVVDFVATKGALQTQTWNFTRPPLKNFTGEDLVPNRLCTLNYGGNSRSCANSFSTPIVDQDVTVKVKVYATNYGVTTDLTSGMGFVNMYKFSPSQTDISQSNYQGARVATMPIGSDGQAEFKVKAGDIVHFVGFQYQTNATSNQFARYNFPSGPYKNYSAENGRGLCRITSPTDCSQDTQTFATPAVDQDVKVSVTAYSGNATNLLSNAPVAMYKVDVNTRKGSAPTMITTSARGQPAEFTIKIGEVVSFIAYKDATAYHRLNGSASGKVFAAGDQLYKNLGPDRPGRFCQNTESENCRYSFNLEAQN